MGRSLLIRWFRCGNGGGTGTAKPLTVDTDKALQTLRDLALCLSRTLDRDGGSSETDQAVSDMCATFIALDESLSGGDRAPDDWRVKGNWSETTNLPRSAEE